MNKETQTPSDFAGIVQDFQPLGKLISAMFAMFITGFSHGYCYLLRSHEQDNIKKFIMNSYRKIQKLVTENFNLLLSGKLNSSMSFFCDIFFLHGKRSDHFRIRSNEDRK